MSAGGDDLGSIQSELHAVKQALREGTGYLGMTGETLQRYLLQLNEKENLLLSRQLQHMTVGNDVGRGPSMGMIGNGYGGGALGVSQAPARPPPQGPAKTLNRDSLPAVFDHMVEYEAVPLEVARALRALSSLAYANANQVGGDTRIIVQLLRLVALHAEEGMVQLNGMRALCNMAYDQTIAVTSLVDPKVMAALLNAVARAPDPKAAPSGDPAVAKTKTEAAAKAGEAVARIVAADLNPEEQTERTAPAGTGALVGLFVAASGGEAQWQGAIPVLMSQLVANEVIAVRTIAEHLTKDTLGLSGQVAVGWLSLAKLLASCDIPELAAAMIDTGAIRMAVGLMERGLDDAGIQLGGVEAMSALVGNRWAGLLSFAESGGIKRIEAAMQRHPKETTLQTKSIRALASGVLWPPEVQEKASYSASRSVDLTKSAMSNHEECLELQQAALEALSKYLDKPKCVGEVSSGGGEGLVKVTMVRHADDSKVQQWGRRVLDGLGVDPKWAPKGGAK